MRIFILFFLLTFLGNGAIAQKKPQPELLDNSLLLKFGPLALFSFDAGPELYLEYQVPKKNLGVQLGLRPILYNLYLGEETGSGSDVPIGVIRSSQPLGFDIRPEIRLYLNGFKPGRARVYVSTDVFFQHIETNRLQQFRIISGNNIFFQEAEYKDIKNVYGFSFKSGVMKHFEDKPVMLEISYGIGLRFRNFRYEGLPEGATEPGRTGDVLFGSPADNKVVPAFPISFRLVVNLSHKKNKRINNGED